MAANPTGSGGLIMCPVGFSLCRFVITPRSDQCRLRGLSFAPSFKRAGDLMDRYGRFSPTKSRIPLACSGEIANSIVAAIVSR